MMRLYVLTHHAVLDDSAVGQLDVLVVDQDQETVLAQFGGVELLHHGTLVGQAQHLGTVNAVGVVQNTTAVNDGLRISS